MSAISVTKARENIYQLLADVNNNSEPVTIPNSRGKDGVLVGKNNACVDTL